MDQTTQNKEIEIDLSKIFYKMRNKFVFIALITIVVGIIAGLYTQFGIKPTYSATVKMYVYSNTDRVVSDSTITSSELAASQDLVGTYIYILKSDTVLDAVIKDLNLNISPTVLKSAISAEQPKGTVAFEVTVTATSPKTAAKVANSIAKIAPSEIVRVVKAGGVEIIDYAKIPKKPSSPNLGKNVLVAAAAALILSFFAFFLLEMFDTTVTSARDIESEFDIPILGTVPNLDGEANRSQQGRISVATNTTKATDSPSELTLKPSNTILENLQNMKEEETKND